MTFKQHFVALLLLLLLEKNFLKTMVLDASDSNFKLWVAYIWRYQISILQWKCSTALHRPYIQTRSRRQGGISILQMSTVLLLEPCRNSRQIISELEFKSVCFVDTK